MQKQLTAVKSNTATAITLQQLVTKLVCNSMPAAHHNNTLVSNEVGQGIELGNETDQAATVICEIIRTVIGNSRNGEIHITADRYSDIVVVQVQERNNYNGYALAYSIGSIEPDAAKIGGHISIKGQQQKIATISFSFPSYLLAA